ncbi:MAG: AbrB/MazE/SpoVT family DNA-binding domain-containing protein [Rhodospirillaceae bacterium]|nr:AbrB/MazE/SpoVT family DNA-binding domain-containing protein [Rhodospirillaceae bacterium]
MVTSTLTAKGQTTIPKDVRERLNLKPGDELMYTVDAGRIIIRPRTGSVKDLEGILPQPTRKATLRDMKSAIAAGAAKRARR